MRKFDSTDDAGKIETRKQDRWEADGNHWLEMVWSGLLWTGLTYLWFMEICKRLTELRQLSVWKQLFMCFIEKCAHGEISVWVNKTIPIFWLGQFVLMRFIVVYISRWILAPCCCTAFANVFAVGYFHLFMISLLLFKKSFQAIGSRLFSIFFWQRTG